MMLQKAERSRLSPPVQGALDLNTISEIGNAYRSKANQHFLAYRHLIDPTLVCGWWQKHAANHLKQFYLDLVAGKRPKLVLKAPPQHGKSRLVHDFITWVAGKQPDWNTIYASYSDELGTTAALRVQRTLELPFYHGAFPATRLASMNRVFDGQRNTTVAEFVKHKGSFRATTVSGQVTGHGLDLGVIDDPIKGRAEASSKTIREKTWNWLVDDFFSRFADHAGLLMIMTRWHVDDPVGRWLEKFPETKVLSYQAVADADDWSVLEGHRKAGEALFPQWKQLDFLMERKRLSTTASWESLYQQSPIIAGGGTFPIEKFGYVNALEHDGIKKSVRYLDKAATEGGGAYSALVLMHMMHDGTFVISDVKRGQWSAMEREKTLLRTAESDQIRLERNYSVYVEQEPGSGGKESAENSIRMLKGYRAYADKVTGDKEVRAEPYAAQVQGGNVWLVRAGWNEPFLDEHECLDETAEVVTMAGTKPITDVRVGDLVMTRCGWRRVLKAGLTGRKPLCLISLSNGQRLKTTFGHPIFVPSYGFKRAGDLMVGESLLQFIGASYFGGSRVSGGATSAAESEIEKSCFTGSSTSRKWDRYLSGITSTTRMVTRRTTRLRTSSVWMGLRTSAFRVAARLSDASTAVRATWQRLARTVATVLDVASMRPLVIVPDHVAGVVAVSANNGFTFVTSTARSISIAAECVQRLGGGARERRGEPVIAITASVPSSQGMAGTGFVADSVRVAAILPLDGIHDVYNLEVEECHEFVANGVLVHNCFPNGPRKDQVDAASGAFNKLVSGSNYDSTYSGF